ncbi:MAG: hypothetical protein P8Y45_08515 [Exilibacterium sp.]
MFKNQKAKCQTLTKQRCCSSDMRWKEKITAAAWQNPRKEKQRSGSGPKIYAPMGFKPSLGLACGIPTASGLWRDFTSSDLPPDEMMNNVCFSY